MRLTQARIEAVLLDLDDTILHDDEATAAAFAATAEIARERAGVDADHLIAAVMRESAALWAEGPYPEWAHGIGTSEVEGLRARFEGEHPHWVAMREWGPRFRRESWTRALAACGVDDAALARELDVRFDEERSAANPFIMGAEEALHELRRHYRLAMVTNGIPDVQRTKIERASLAEYFDLLIVSGELGYGKPDARIYEETARRLGVSPAACIMVGDNFRRDVLGAQEAGIRGVWISIGRDQPASDVSPWMTIVSLAELPARLAEIRGEA